MEGGVMVEKVGLAGAVADPTLAAVDLTSVVATAAVAGPATAGEPCSAELIGSVDYPKGTRVWQQVNCDTEIVSSQR